MEKCSKSFAIQIVKGIAVSVFCTMAAILLFAVVLKIATVSHTAVKAVNQFIRCVALFLGCFFSFCGKNGLSKGVITGGLWAIIMFVIFTLFGNSYGLLSDVIFGVIVGGISGIATVNFKGEK